MWYFARRKSINFVATRFHTLGLPPGRNQFLGDDDDRRTRVSLRSFEVRKKQVSVRPALLRNRFMICVVPTARESLPVAVAVGWAVFLYFSRRQGSGLFTFLLPIVRSFGKCVDASTWSFVERKQFPSYEYLSVTRRSPARFNWQIDRSTVDRLTETGIIHTALFCTYPECESNDFHSITEHQLTPLREEHRTKQRGSSEPVQIPLHSRNFSHINHRSSSSCCHCFAASPLTAGKPQNNLNNNIDIDNDVDYDDAG